MSELSMAVARARAMRAGNYLAAPQALADEKARHEQEVTELRHQWESERQVYESRLQSLSAEIAVQREVIKNMAENSIKLEKLSPRFELIRKMVCEYRNVSLEDFCSIRHTHNSARARQEAYWIARELTTLSTTQLGRICGGSGRDHSTVVHGLRKTNERMAANPAYAAEVLTLKAKIEMACNDNSAITSAAERQPDAQG